MSESESVRSRDPGQLPVYKHLSTVIMLLGLGGNALRDSHVAIGVLLLLGAAIFLVLAVRSVLARRQR